MRVLVTGGSGFIGSHVVDKLVDAGHTPVIFDLRPSPHHLPEEVDTVLGDLLEVEDLRVAMEGCDAVIHLAAAADVGVVAEQPEDSERLNARGTIAVLEAARATKIGRVVYGSTIWVYGESGDGVIDEDAPLGLPSHLYTASKLAGEMYCSSYEELYDVPCTILRFGIPYGPRARPAAVIPIFVRKALAGEPLTIAGDGAQTRRFVYVEDLAEGVVKGLDHGRPNRVYNLASNQTVTIKELAETVRGQTRDVDLVHTPGRNGDFGGAEISSERAAEELGWTASTPLSEGVRRYVSWLAPEPALEQEPALVAAPVAEQAPAVIQASAALEPVQASRQRFFDLVVGDNRVAAIACAIGTIVPYLTAYRLDEFDKPQVHAVGITTLALTLICLSLMQSASTSSRQRPRNGLMAAGWLLVGYFVLVTLRWTQDRLILALPEWQTLLAAMIGTGMALATAVALNRSEHEGERPDRRAPRAGGAVMIGVVEQQHVAPAQVARHLLGDRRRRRPTAPVVAPVRPEQRAQTAAGHDPQPRRAENPQGGPVDGRSGAARLGDHGGRPLEIRRELGRREAQHVPVAVPVHRERVPG